MSGKWTVEIEEPDYLDGIQSGVTIFGAERRIVAYAFDAKEGAMLAAAPTMADALKALLDAWESDNISLPIALAGQIKAALSQALGEGQ